MYTGGTKCWNGPERSVKLVMSCGTSTEIVSVTEPEKCEYLFKLQTPAVCPVSEDVEGEDADADAEEGHEVEGEDMYQHEDEHADQNTREHDEL